MKPTQRAWEEILFQPLATAGLVDNHRLTKYTTP